MTVDDVHRHLVELQRIADTNDGNRADGSPGHQASLLITTPPSGLRALTFSPGYYGDLTVPVGRPAAS